MPRNTTPSTSALRWEAPPTATRITATTNPDRFAAEAAELRTHPGEWAVLTEIKPGKNARSQAYRVTSGVAKAKFPVFQPPGSFEATSRTPVKDGPTLVYARYVGTPEAPAAGEPEAQAQ